MHSEFHGLLPLPAPACADALDVPALLTRAARPWLVLEPAGRAPWPGRWADADGRHLVRVRLLGWLPLGWHRLDVEARRFPGSEASLRLCLTRFRADGRAPRWRLESLTTLVPAFGGTRHTDWLDVRAGWLTPLAWLAGVACVWHRRRRWQRLAALWRDAHRDPPRARPAALAAAVSPLGLPRP